MISEFFREIDAMPIANEVIEDVTKVFFEKTLMFASATHISARDLHINQLPLSGNCDFQYDRYAIALKKIMPIQHVCLK